MHIYFWQTYVPLVFQTIFDAKFSTFFRNDWIVPGFECESPEEINFGTLDKYKGEKLSITTCF